MSHQHLAVVAVLAVALAGCPAAKTPTGPGKTTGTTTAAKTVALTGVVAAPAGIVAQGAGNVVAQGGGNIVAQGAGNIVAQGAGNRRLLATGSTTLAGTAVILVNAQTLKEVQRTKTDAKGGYSFSKLTSGTTYRVLAAGLKDGAPVTLSTIAKAGGKPADINLATTCTLMACLIKGKNQTNSVDPTKFAAMVAGFSDAIKDVEPPDLSKPANLPHWLGCHLTADLRAQMDGLVATMAKVDQILASLTAKKAHVLDLASDIADATQAASQAAGDATQAAGEATKAAAEAVKSAGEIVKQSEELASSMGIGDMAKAAAQLDGCE